MEEGLFEKCSLIAGASVKAAKSLVNGDTDVAINWCGGWHHAKRLVHNIRVQVTSEGSSLLMAVALTL